MSKNKKKARNLKYLSLRKEEQAPKIGSFIEEKDTLIAQKISDENVSLFMTDQNGKVMQATMIDQNATKCPVNVDVLAFIRENRKAIKELLDVETRKLTFEVDGDLFEEAFVVDADGNKHPIANGNTITADLGATYKIVGVGKTSIFFNYDSYARGGSGAFETTFTRPAIGNIYISLQNVMKEYNAPEVEDDE